MNDPELTAAFGQAGLERAQRWYGWPGVAESLAMHYARIGAGRLAISTAVADSEARRDAAETIASALQPEAQSRVQSAVSLPTSAVA
jgi:hypothetical protein